MDDLKLFLKVVNIPYNTLQKYVKGIWILGTHVRRQSLINTLDGRFLAEVFARKDWSNDGEEMDNVLAMMQEVNPKLTVTQARVHYHCTLKRNNGNLIKGKLRIVQGTTTKRCAVTVAQKLRCHKLLKEYRNLSVLRKDICGAD